MSSTTQAERIEQLKAIFRQMSDREREDAYSELKGEWCQWCGGKQNRDGYCQCMTDE
jgi:hypothetical protein